MVTPNVPTAHDILWSRTARPGWLRTLALALFPGWRA